MFSNWHSSASTIDIPNSWARALEAVRSSGSDGPPRVLVAGEIDSGKSTFARWMAEAAGLSFWVLETDPGQPARGVPGTVSLFRPDGTLAAAYFVGDFSPVRVLPVFLDGVVCLGRHVPQDAALVVDTCGLVAPPLGLSLKLFKVRVLDVTTCVCLYRTDGGRRHVERLADVVRSRGRQAPVIEASPAARAIPAAARQLRRSVLLQKHFSRVVEKTLTVLREKVDSSVAIEGGAFGCMRGSYIALLDDEGCVLSLGICQDVREEAGAVILRGLLDREPDSEASSVMVRPGRILLKPDGSFQGYVRATPLDTGQPA